MARTRRSLPEPTKPCPICNHDFPISCLLGHASNCTGQNRKKTPESTPGSSPGSSSTNFLFQTPKTDNNLINHNSSGEEILREKHFEKVNSDFQEKLSFKLKTSRKVENSKEFRAIGPTRSKKLKKSKKSTPKSTVIYQYKEYRPVPSETESESSTNWIMKIDENTIQSIINSSQVPKNQENQEKSLVQAQTPIKIDKIHDKVHDKMHKAVQTTLNVQITKKRKKNLKPSHSVHFEVQPT